MRSFKLLGLALMTALALAITTATATAVEMELPEFLTKTSWTGTSGSGEFLSAAAKITCAAGTSSGEMEASKKLGTYAFTFTGCESANFISPCNSVGAAAKTIMTNGTWHLVLTTGDGEDIHLIWFLLKELGVECGGLAKIKIKGNVLGSIIPSDTLTKIYRAILLINIANQQEETSFENDEGLPVSASLLANINGGTFGPAMEDSPSNVLTTTLDTLIIN
jgi:hypothetical protein